MPIPIFTGFLIAAPLSSISNDGPAASRSLDYPTGAALVEAITIAAQARTTTILDSRVSRSGVAITGTGTDCIVVSAPLGGSVRFTGLHTAIGEAIGASVYRAMRDGIATWLLDTETMRPAVGLER